MPYNDPILRGPGGYFKAEEPGRRERADAWGTTFNGDFADLIPYKETTK